jgi:glyoxylase-like metal-dependent hydrolase (beta-lactamase superfamily II)
MVNVYLVEDERGLTLIDAGIPGLWKELIAELDAMTRSLDDIRGVLLTHADDDHLGFAERLRTDHGVTIYVHEADAPQARGDVKKKNPSWGKMRVGPTLSFLWYAGRRGGLSVKPVGDVTTIQDGDILDLPGDPRVIHTPGHSPGSIAIHSPAVDSLFVGDAMTTRHVLTGVEGAQPAPFTLDPESALQSLEKWLDFNARWVLPGHGHPWDEGIQKAVAEIHAAARR